MEFPIEEIQRWADGFYEKGMSRGENSPIAGGPELPSAVNSRGAGLTTQPASGYFSFPTHQISLALPSVAAL